MKHAPLPTRRAIRRGFRWPARKLPALTRQTAAAIAGNEDAKFEQSRTAAVHPCRNCGTELHGAYCHHCGQPTRSIIRFFPALVWDLLDDLFDLDSRLARTLKPLLFQPGRLTNEYIAGRRFRYVAPLRLYLFISVAFFIALRILAGDAQVTSETPSRPPSGLENKTVAQPDPADPSAAPVAKPDDFKITLNNQPVSVDQYDPVANPVRIRWLNPEQRVAMSRVLKDMGMNLKYAVRENPRPLINQLLGILPQTMFVLLPLFALLLKLAYLFKRRYYTEHLITALHSHAFLFLALLLMMLIVNGSNWLGLHFTGLHKSMHALSSWLAVAISLWMPLYLLLMQKRVYGQGWTMTVVKFFVLSQAYLLLLTLGAMATLLTSLLLVS